MACSQRSMIELSNKSKLEILNFCQDHGLIGEYYKCPTCNGRMKLSRCKSRDGFRWQCASKNKGSEHHVRRTLRRGTWFALSNLSLSDILLLTYYWVMEYPQKLAIADMSIVNGTSVGWYNLCREVCVEVLVRSEQQIGGPGKTVEICETKFAHRKFNRGKKIERPSFFIGVCRESKLCFVAPVQEGSTAETLLELIKRKLMPGTVVYSDCWESYGLFQNEGFSQLTETHSITLKDSESGCHTRVMKGLWKQFRSYLPCQKRLKLEFNSYLAEYIYRRQMPSDENKLSAFLRDIASIYAPQNEDPKTSEDSNKPSYPHISEIEIQNFVGFNSDIVKIEPKEELNEEFLEEEFQSEEMEYFSFEETTFKGAECSVAEEIERIATTNETGNERNLMIECDETNAEGEELFVVQGIKIEEPEIDSIYQKW